MKKLITICLACVLLTAAVQAVPIKIEPNSVSVVLVVDPGYPVPSLWVCEWLELSTAGNTTSWIVHADEDIWDLHFGTWDDWYYLTPGLTPFGQSSFTCTYEEEGGPPVQGVDPQPYWQTLDLWDGIMLECTYWEINIDHVPTLGGVAQNLWVHPTPEPATIGLLGLGALSLLRRKR